MSLETSGIASSPELDRKIADDLDTAEEVTGRTKLRIRKAIKDGELEARRDGRRLLVEPEELRRWVRSLPLAIRK
jgi:excisionase family DNA binding protein